MKKKNEGEEEELNKIRKNKPTLSEERRWDEKWRRNEGMAEYRSHGALINTEGAVDAFDFNL